MIISLHLRSINFFYLFYFWNLLFSLKLKKITFIYFFFFKKKNAQLMFCTLQKFNYCNYFLFSFKKINRIKQFTSIKNKMSINRINYNYTLKKKNKPVILNLFLIKFLNKHYYEKSFILNNLYFNFELNFFNNFKNYLNLHLLKLNRPSKKIKKTNFFKINKRKIWKKWKQKNKFFFFKKKFQHLLNKYEIINKVKTKQKILTIFNKLNNSLKIQKQTSQILTNKDSLKQKTYKENFTKLTRTFPFFYILIKFFKFYYNLSYAHLTCTYSIFNFSFYELSLNKLAQELLHKKKNNYQLIQLNIGRSFRFFSFSECLIFNSFFI